MPANTSNTPERRRAQAPAPMQQPEPAKAKAAPDAPESPRRRRRPDATAEVVGRRLGVNKAILDLAEYAYRWINDDDARIFAMTREDDWDFVTEKGVVADPEDLGARLAKVVGTKPDGSPLKAFLCRKPRVLEEMDRRKKTDAQAQIMKELRRGNDKAGAAQSDYVPNGGITIDA